jgi:hypothetical protein
MKDSAIKKLTHQLIFTIYLMLINASFNMDKIKQHRLLAFNGP